MTHPQHANPTDGRHLHPSYGLGVRRIPTRTPQQSARRSHWATYRLHLRLGLVSFNEGMFLAIPAVLIGAAMQNQTVAVVGALTAVAVGLFLIAPLCSMAHSIRRHRLMRARAQVRVAQRAHLVAVTEGANL